MTHGPRLTERQERVWNDPHYLAKEGQTVSKEGQTTPDIRSFPFSFLSFRPRSSFEGRSESFGKERRIWNDLRTRPERGKGWDKSGLISPIERHHSCIILLSFCSFHYHSTDFSDGLLDPLANVLLHVLILVHHWHRHLSWIKRHLKNIDEDI